MSSPIEVYDERLMQLIDEVASHDIHTKEFNEASKNLRVYLESRQLFPKPAPEPEPVCEPQTRWEKVKAVTAAVWDNETTRVAIKAAGAFGGVLLVVASTVKRDHVVQREALSQANQRPS